MGEWWRLPGFPTDGEWQALWTFLATVAAFLLLVIAWRQLKGLADSNRILADSNRLLSESNESLQRPYVAVDFGFKRHMNKNAMHGERNTLTLKVSSIGRSSALDVRIVTKPELASTLTILNGDEGESRAALERVRPFFDGRKRFSALHPDRVIEFVLDALPAAMNDPGVPQGYDVTVAYRDVSGRIYEDEYRIELGDWKYAYPDDDPLQRISKDIQALNDKVGEVARTRR